ncbi:universal stress protein [Streptomyces axinellae]|uniref:Universal stress protein n=1 Tax=Streptomyces axinellae TaxID=552788 RepID=A0ABN3PL53_9ACTN
MTGTRILVGVDPDPAGQTALTWAADEAARQRASLLLLHAWTMFFPAYTDPKMGSDLIVLLRDRGQRVLEAAAQIVLKRCPHVEVSTVLEEEDPIWALREHAKSASLLVLGTRPWQESHHIAASPVAGPVIAHVHCPVAVVRENTEPAVPPFFVAGADGSPTSARALHLAFAQAAAREAAVRVRYAWQPPRLGVLDERAAVREAEHLLDKEIATARAEHPGVPYDREVVRGHPVEVLSQAAEGALGLVVGTRGHGGFTGMLLGSVSQGVLRHARSHVLVVPEPAAR